MFTVKPNVIQIIWVNMSVCIMDYCDYDFPEGDFLPASTY